jgi:uncharacterized protein (DUF1697 family)
MQRYIGFLRSINIGGRRVTGRELERIFSGLGLASPVSFLSSGNVVFDAEPSPFHAKNIETGLHESLGYSVPVVLRTAEEVQAIATTQPFSAEQLGSSTGKVQVSLFVELPAPKNARAVLDMATPEDLLHIQGRELYWLPAAGMSDAALDTLLIEKLLGTQTRRTLNTLQRLTKKFLT